MTNQTPIVSKSDPVAQCIFNYKEESETARRNRSILNRENFECYNLRQDYTHKLRGQSKEFLGKQSMATERLASFLQQGLMDLGDWFRIEPQPGVKAEDLKIHPKEMQLLILRHLEINNFDNFFHDALKFGILGSLMIVKVGGKMCPKAEFEARASAGDLSGRKKDLIRKVRQYWELQLSLVRHEDFFPDPSGDGLYNIERVEMDHHALIQLAENNPDAGFDLDAIKNMTAQIDDLQKAKKSRETGQNPTYSQYRKRVTFYDFEGTLLEQGTGKVLMENCLAACDLQGNVIRKPIKNPYWHGGSQYIAAPIIRVPRSVWHRALADAGTKHNQAMNEVWNLMVDGAMMEVHGIKQVHAAWLEDPSQVSDGIKPGSSLLVNSQCPPGAKVLERVDTSALTPESMNMFHQIDSEFQSSMLTNDTSQGSLPQRAVKATEVVASNQALTGIMNGIVKVIEGECVSKLLEKVWLTLAQHMNDLDVAEVQALLGKERGQMIAGLTQEEIFADTAEKHSYKVFGLSMTLNKIQDFRKIQALLQSIGASPQMMAEFVRKYSMTKLLGEIVKSLDIDEDKILAEPQEADARLNEQKQQAQVAAQASGEPQGNTSGGEGENPQSQIPQMGNNSTIDTGITIPRGMNNSGGLTSPQG